MIGSEGKPLLTRTDLPLDKIALICRRWDARELAIDTWDAVTESVPALLNEIRRYVARVGLGGELSH